VVAVAVQVMPPEPVPVDIEHQLEHQAAIHLPKAHFH
jgi:hypothetical protein